MTVTLTHPFTGEVKAEGDHALAVLAASGVPAADGASCGPYIVRVVGEVKHASHDQSSHGNRKTSSRVLGNSDNLDVLWHSALSPLEARRAKADTAKKVGARLRADLTEAALEEGLRGLTGALVGDLPETSEDPHERVASYLIQGWATSATGGTSASVQSAVADLFNVPDERPVYGGGYDPERRPAEAALLRSFARAQYDETQALFAEAGVTHVPLYRGMTHDESGRMYPLSSWSVDLDIATVFATSDAEVEVSPHSFGSAAEDAEDIVRGAGPDGLVVEVPSDAEEYPGQHAEVRYSSENEDYTDWIESEPERNDFDTEEEYEEALEGWEEGEVDYDVDVIIHAVIYKQDIPVERIFSTPRTGMGCLTEHECVVLGGAPLQAKHLPGEHDQTDHGNRYPVLTVSAVRDSPDTRFVVQEDFGGDTFTFVGFESESIAGVRLFGPDETFAGGIHWMASRISVESVSVEKPFRRRGIATRLWELAREVKPDLRHSKTQTDDGEGWAASLALKHLPGEHDQTSHGRRGPSVKPLAGVDGFYRLVEDLVAGATPEHQVELTAKHVSAFTDPRDPLYPAVAKAGSALAVAADEGVEGPGGGLSFDFGLWAHHVDTLLDAIDDFEVPGPEGYDSPHEYETDVDNMVADVQELAYHEVWWVLSDDTRVMADGRALPVTKPGTLTLRGTPVDVYSYGTSEAAAVALKKNATTLLAARLTPETVDALTLPLWGADMRMYPQSERANTVASQYIRLWAGTANDESPMALLAQEAAKREFGLSGTAGWRVPNKDYSAPDAPEEVEWSPDLPDQKHHTRVIKDPEAVITAMQQVQRAMYDITQERLKEKGVTELEVRRGVKSYDGTARPLASWTLDTNTADNFSGAGVSQWADDEVDLVADPGARYREAPKGAIIRDVVPASRVLGFPGFGVGCLNEYECVLLAHAPGPVGQPPLPLDLKHGGPGPHTTGTPQSAHGGGGAALPSAGAVWGTGADLVQTLQDMDTVWSGLNLRTVLAGGVPIGDRAVPMGAKVVPDGSSPEDVRAYLAGLPEEGQEGAAFPAHEQGVTLMDSGRVHHVIGNADSITQQRRDFIALREEGVALDAHNHPNNNSFSPGDLRSYATVQPRVAEVVAGDHAYRLTVDPDADEAFEWFYVNALADASIDILSARYYDATDRFDRSEMDEDEYLSTDWFGEGTGRTIGEALVLALVEEFPAAVTYERTGEPDLSPSDWTKATALSHLQMLRAWNEGHGAWDAKPEVRYEAKADGADDLMDSDCAGRRLLAGVEPETKHAGPGPHKTGTPQAVHGGGGGPDRPRMNARWVQSLRANLRALSEPDRERVRAMVTSAKVWVRVPSEVIVPITEDGEFRNQHETGGSRGHLGSTLRFAAEHVLFGYDPKGEAAGRQHPVYGYLSESGEPRNTDLGQYGDIALAFGGDAVTDRTTVMFGDSLDDSNIVWTAEVMAARGFSVSGDPLPWQPKRAPTPLADPDPEVFNDHMYGSDARATSVDTLSKYVEAHVHGRNPTLDDVTDVLIDHEYADQMAPALRALMDGDSSLFDALYDEFAENAIDTDVLLAIEALHDAFDGRPVTFTAISGSATLWANS